MRSFLLAARVSLAAAISAQPALAEGGWASSSQVFLVKAADGSLSVVRRNVRVWDPEPELGLEFSWEPENGGPALRSDGIAEGAGKLVWRVKGEPSYRRHAIHHAYSGEMMNGRPHGKGKLTLRSGEAFDGAWVNGLMNGQGSHSAENGDLYSGEFRHGLRNGRGILYFSNGNIYEGAFENGLRHGQGLMKLAGGGSWSGLWRNDAFEGAPSLKSDVLAGGLALAAQSGGDAARTTIGLGIDKRATDANHGVQFAVAPAAESVLVYPETPTLNDRWTGKHTIIGEPYWVYDLDINWEGTAVFLKGEVAASDGKPFSLAAIRVNVKESRPYLKPFLSIVPDFGCTSFRPHFSFQNDGRGDARSASFFYAFTSEDGRQRSKTFKQALGNIKPGKSISVEKDIFALVGGKAALKTTRFVCSGENNTDECRKDPVSRMQLGAFAPFAFASVNTDIGFGPGGSLNDRHIVTRLDGFLEYEWGDSQGRSQKTREALEAFVSIGTVEPYEKLAECGGLWGGSPEAPKYLKAALADSRTDYSFRFPVSGKDQQKRYPVLLQLTAPATSEHELVIEAEFADGSVRSSKPYILRYPIMNPENLPDLYGSGDQCYLPSYGAC